MSREEYIIRLKFELLLSNYKIDNRYKWVAMDKCGEYYVYAMKPIVEGYEWRYDSTTLDSDDFNPNERLHKPFIKLPTYIDWEDTLISVKELQE